MPSPIKAISAGLSNLWYVWPSKIQFEPGFNIVRDIDYDADPESVALLDPDIVAKAVSIKDQGIRIPINGSMVAGKIRPTNGHRRICALRLALKRGWLKPKDPRARVPILPEPQHHGRAARILDTLILNMSKPPSIMGKARAIRELIDEHGDTEEGVQAKTGYSITHIRDCLLLLGAAPELQQAVAEGRLAATTAIDMARDLTHEQQVEALAKAAEKAGDGKITPKDLPVKVGRDRRAAQQADTGKRIPESEDTDSDDDTDSNPAPQEDASTSQHSTLNSQPAAPFEGAEPDTPVTNEYGEFTDGIEDFPIPFTAKGVSAKLHLVEEGGQHYVGYTLKHPAQAKGEGFRHVKPRRGDRPIPCRNHAIIAGLLILRSHLEVATFKDQPRALEDLDEQLADLTKGMPRPMRESLSPKARAEQPPPVDLVPANEVTWARQLAEHLRDLLHGDPKVRDLTETAARQFLAQYDHAHPRT